MRPAYTFTSLKLMMSYTCARSIAAMLLSLSLVSPCRAQYGQTSELQPPPQMRAPLQGQVEKSTIINPETQYRQGPPVYSPPVYSPPAYNPPTYSPPAYTPPPYTPLDAFAEKNQFQPDTPQYDYGTPAPQPNPRNTNLKAILQALMAIQGQQQSPNEAPPVVRPNWLPAYAYTNESMVAPYHHLDIAWWNKQKIPNQKKWVKLSDSVTKYWRGFVPEPCMVLVVPMDEAPGNFTFRCPASRGPSGWLQFTEMSDRYGFPLYRYWFGQP